MDAPAYAKVWRVSLVPFRGFVVQIVSKLILWKGGEGKTLTSTR